ncbi:MAG TPA: hypothetical protein VMA74_16940 [Dyella sp.]|uniref:gp53-like domain-containing protein n=1 Tax=Dyella sp. TaxID=1869338 RepID=UPI002BFA08ED|nr:hypothetical protein [Dyella sp.]HUB91412.1 hypothetical protein [Dyella sp.]
MRRQIIYPGQVPLETDMLNTNRNVMIALGKLAGALLGTGGLVNGLAVTPTQPASLSVQIAAGEIYQLENVDNTAYSSLASDTTDTCVKQGIQLQPTTIAIAPPNTAGYSQCFLIEATFQENDINNVVLPYFNSSNTNQALNGPPGNPDQEQPTQRDGQVILQAKAGIAAATGTQVAPAVDPGYIALAVVTVANGQVTITAANISAVTTGVLPASLLQALQNNSLCYAKDVGAVNALVVNLQPAPTALVDGMLVETQVAVTNTGPTTLNLNGLGAKPVLGAAHAVLQGGELPAGGKAEFMWHAGLASWILIEGTGGAQQLGAGTYGVPPTQFDNSAKLVPSSWVQTLLGNTRPSVIGITVTGQALTVAQCGQNVAINIPAAGTLSLPSPVNQNGIAFYLNNYSSTYAVTIQTPAGNFNPAAAGSTTSYLLPPSASVIVISDGTNWIVFGGVGANSLSASGYQKLSSGIIFQWGAITAAAATNTAVVFPISFPNNCFFATANPNDGGTTASYRYSANGWTKTGLNVVNTYSGNSIPGVWFAIGN